MVNCADKFLKHSERVGARFAEQNAGAQYQSYHRTNSNFGHRSYEYCTKVAECLARSTTVHTYSNPFTVNVSPFPTCAVVLLGSYCPHTAVIHCARV